MVAFRSQRQVPTVLSFTLHVQFLEVGDLPVVLQRQVLGLWLQKTADSSQLQFIAVDDIPVVAQFLMVQTVQKTIVIHQLQSFDKVVDVPLEVVDIPVVTQKAYPHGPNCSENHRNSPVPR